MCRGVIFHYCLTWNQSLYQVRVKVFLMCNANEAVQVVSWYMLRRHEMFVFNLIPLQDKWHYDTSSTL